MHKEHWSEGQSWSCLPHAVACFALTFWIQANVGVAWSFAPLVLGLAFMSCESGFVWEGESRRGRSYTGWVVAGTFLVWGRWKTVPAAFAVQLEHTNESMMNSRGAPRSVKIDSWELQWQDEQGRWHVLHDFTNRHQAQSALSAVKYSLHC